MSTTLKRFVKGIVLRGESSDVTENLEGSLFNNSTDQRVKAYIQGAVREVLTNSQQQTLTNKTIDADSNAISNLELDNLKSGVLDTDLTSVSSSDDTIPSAKAVKTFVDNSTGVVAGNLTSHINNTTGAHAASAISVTPTGNLASINVQTALVELQTDVDGKVSGAGSATNNAIVRFNTTSGTFIKNSVAVLGDGGLLTGLTEIQIDDTDPAGNKLAFNKNGISDRDVTSGLIFSKTSGIVDVSVAGRYVSLTGNTLLPTTTNNAATGSNAGVSFGNFSNVILTNSGLISVSGITSKNNGSLLILTNNTGNDVEVINNGPSSPQILTGTESDITFRNQSSLFLTYNNSLGKWIVVGGTGGSTSSTKQIAGENLTANDLVYQSKVDGKIYKAQANDDDKVDVLGFARKTALANASVEINTGGIIKGFTGLSAGNLYYLRADLAGGISTTAPSTNGQWVVAVGMAVSATELVINPVASSSAIYLTDSEYSFSIVNNTTSPSNVTSLVFDPIQVRSFLVDYSIYRESSTESDAQIGQLRGIYNTKTSTWFLSDDYAGENAGVSFTISASGQVQYTSSNFSGTSHIGTLKYAIKRTFSI